MAKRDDPAHLTRLVPLADLKPHPRNYRSHPDDQLEHLMQSLREFGWYRNVVTARDHTILAGHGIVLAAAKLGWVDAPVIALDLDPLEPRALKVLAADNFVSHLAVDDDRQLTEMLKELREFDVDALLGTGFDDLSLSAFLMVTRPASEISDFDAAAEWTGMPEFQAVKTGPQLMVEFVDADARARFVEQSEGLMITYRKNTDAIFTSGRLWSARWIEDPAERERQDPGALIFEG